jgi:hypothetical protein
MIISVTVNTIRLAGMAGLAEWGAVEDGGDWGRAGPVEIEVPRDRESSFEPVIVGKRQR